MQERYSSRKMKILITGAAGFLGRALSERLLSDGAHRDDQITLTDRVPISLTDPRVSFTVGDLNDPALVRELVAGAQVIYHLAAMPGGAAEQDYEGSRKVNLGASLELMDQAAAVSDRRVRFVYASSIAVFGEPLPEHVDDNTCPRPGMTYGAHKLMVSIALSNLVRMQRLDGFALHLPGLVARPRSAAGMTSAFMSDVFHALANSERYVLPVSPTATAWLMSLSCCVDNLVHAGSLPSILGAGRRAFTLPAVRTSMRDLVDEIARQTRADPSYIGFAPDAEVEARFGRLPPLRTPWAEAQGFRSDVSLPALVTRALAAAGYDCMRAISI